LLELDGRLGFDDLIIHGMSWFDILAEIYGGKTVDFVRFVR